MSELLLRNEFSNFFESNFSIAEDDVYETYSNPDLVQELKVEVRLFVKKLNKQGHRSNLLLCVQDKEGCSLFVFSYWIPEELVIPSAEPLSILQNFVVMFGSRIRVGGTEEFFIREKTISLKHSLKHPDQVIQVLGSENIPCQYYFFCNNELVVSDSLVFLDIYYAFSVNNNKYISWLFVFPEVAVRIPRGWAKFLLNIVEVLEPDGKTQLKILRPSRETCVEKVSVSGKEDLEGFVEISVPEKYSHQFNHISNVITSLKPDEKILIFPSFSTPQCLFCNSKDVSKEHIFPRWLRPFFGETLFNSTLLSSDHSHRGVNYDENLLNFFQSAVEGHKESSHGYTTKTVCRECNNTWMSNLEGKAKSILVNENGELIDNLTHIDQDDANFLSRWLLKISLLLADKIMHYEVFSPDEYKNIRIGHIPNGVTVEVAYSESYTLDFLTYSGGSPLVPIRVKTMSTDKAKELSKSFFSTSIQVGKLLFRVSYLPPDSPLFRKVALKRTEALYPWKINLPFHELVAESEIWSKTVSDCLELHMFSSSIILFDRKNIST